MGQKVHPLGYRIGVTENWRSRWYASKKDFGPLLVEDQQIRRYIKKNYPNAEVARVDVERTRDEVVVFVQTGRPGYIIGKKGQEVDALKARLEDEFGRRMELKIMEITNPHRNAALVAERISAQLSKRGSFRRVIKRTLDEVMDAGVNGIKVELSGRLGGAEMSRKEKASRGSIPLSTLQQHVDYGFAVARTAQGVIGVKVWIDLGPYSEEDSDGADAQTRQASKGPKRSHKR